MTYTILEAEHKSGIPSRKIRFWLDKGLFPNIYKDKNGVRLFNQKDIDWLCWINLYRELGMSIKELKYYKDLCEKGDDTLRERLKIIQAQKKKNLAQLAKAQENIAM
ncbi:MerR family transcriptional regulator, partial [Helicobacter rodentium]|uniref:MerR family transcriptional regulator n=1 Tax=Helicobacter rodentium TaxID=59617 RepID=UPI002624E222